MVRDYERRFILLFKKMKHGAEMKDQEAAPRHLDDNMRAGFGRLPDAKTRQRMVELVCSLQLESGPKLGREKK
jgi:hypothetical protein